MNHTKSVTYVPRTICYLCVRSFMVALVGYFFGAAALAVFVDVKKYEHWIVIGILLGAAVVWLIYFLRERKKNRAEHQS